ncbi:chloride channel protein [Bacillus paranthracis]
MTIIGGVLVGLSQKHFGTYPHLMPEVMAEYKKTSRIEYRFVHRATLTAIIVLIFGASLGPEAALVGIIGGLCTWVGDRFNFALKGMNELTEIGIGATLSVIFNAPLFGYLAPNENEGEQIAAFSKGKKAIVYLATTFAGFSVYLLLSKLDNRGSFIVDFGEGALSFNEWIAFLPLASIGAIVGFFYFKLEFTLEKFIHPFREYKLTLGIIGGILLGIAGTFLPYTLFSGGTSIKRISCRMEPFIFLDTTSFRDFKVVRYCRLLKHRVARWTYLPNYIFWVKYRICCSIYSSYRPVASVAIVTTAISSYALRKPIAITLLLLMFFPLNLLLPMLGAAAVGNAFPLPKLNENTN